MLAVLAVPLFSMRLAFSDAGNDPASLTTRQAYDLLADGFGPGFNGPLVIAADLRGPHAQASIARLGARLSHVPGVASASPPIVNVARDAAVIVVYPTTGPIGPWIPRQPWGHDRRSVPDSQGETARA